MIDCSYICTCTPAEGITVSIEERGPDEGPVEWMQRAQRAITDDHKIRAPWCTAAKCDLIIPFEGGRVGEKP